jgi:hypothetical protein
MSRLRDSNALRVKALYAAFAVALPIGAWLSSSDAWLNIAFDPGSESLLRSKPMPMRLAEAQADPPMSTIATPEEFDAAANEERCVLFIDADWSIIAVLGRRVVYDFVREWKASHRSGNIGFFRFDATDQKHRTSAMNSTALSGNRASWWHSGAGPVLFIRRGKVVDAIDWAAGETRASLIEKTRRVMEDD